MVPQLEFKKGSTNLKTNEITLKDHDISSNYAKVIRLSLTINRLYS